MIPKGTFSERSRVSGRTSRPGCEKSGAATAVPLFAGLFDCYRDSGNHIFPACAYPLTQEAVPMILSTLTPELNFALEQLSHRAARGSCVSCDFAGQAGHRRISLGRGTDLSERTTHRRERGASKNPAGSGHQLLALCPAHGGNGTVSAPGKRLPDGPLRETVRGTGKSMGSGTFPLW